MKITDEGWRNAVNCPGYSVHPEGLLKGRRDTLMKGGRDKDGYTIFCIQDAGKPSITKKLHRVMVETFLGAIPEGMCVNHINGVKDDNRICNLEVVTYSANTIHAFEVLKRPPSSASHIGSNNPNAVFTEDDVRLIRQRHANGETGKAIATSLGVSTPCINRMIARKSWAHVA